MRIGRAQLMRLVRLLSSISKRLLYNGRSKSMDVLNFGSIDIGRIFELRVSYDQSLFRHKVDIRKNIATQYKATGAS